MSGACLVDTPRWGMALERDVRLRAGRDLLQGLLASSGTASAASAAQRQALFANAWRSAATRKPPPGAGPAFCRLPLALIVTPSFCRPAASFWNSSRSAAGCSALSGGLAPVLHFATIFGTTPTMLARNA